MEASKSTIAAIATPPGDGGVAILRLSGPEAQTIANHAFSKDVLSMPSNTLCYGNILGSQKEILDQGMCVVMRAPHSYTGEDVVELHCHGGHYLTKNILKALLEMGATPAGPGEFTERAFLNGKLDLAQAEAVQSLISAKNQYALKNASEQLDGALSSKIRSMQEKLLDQAAILEAWVDFPEEGIEYTSLEEIIRLLKEIQQEMSRLIESYECGRALIEGFTLCLVGQPNVGKSSLMNQLLKKERALVTPIAGTTRDTLEEVLNIDGVSYRLIDTAGLRETDELVEKLGIERTTKSYQAADLVLLVLDATQSISQEEEKLIEELQARKQKVLVLWNKMDLESAQTKPLSLKEQIEMSAKSGEGLEALYKKIPELLLDTGALSNEIHLTQLRHKEALIRGLDHLNRVIEGLETEASPEWMTFDLKEALKALSTIIGMDITESILSNIFSRFCIGK